MVNLGTQSGKVIIKVAHRANAPPGSQVQWLGFALLKWNQTDLYISFTLLAAGCVVPSFCSLERGRIYEACGSWWDKQRTQTFRGGKPHQDDDDESMTIHLGAATGRDILECYGCF